MILQVLKIDIFKIYYGPLWIEAIGMGFANILQLGVVTLMQLALPFVELKSHAIVK